MMLLIGVTVAGYSQLSHSAIVVATPGHLAVTVAVDLSQAKDLVSSLRSQLEGGLRSSIEYEIRVSVPRSVPFRFVGNRQIGEFRHSLDVELDPFLNTYTLVDADGARHIFDEWDGMIDFMFSLNGYRIPWGQLQGPFTDSWIRDEERLIIETSVVYTPVVFVPALSILSLFMAGNREHSPVQRVVLDKVLL